MMPKAEWGPGLWHEEPDRLEWTTAAGLPGLALRGPMGAWCGYAAVLPGHPLYDVWYGGCVNGHKPPSKKTQLRRARRRARRAKGKAFPYQSLLRMAKRGWPTRPDCVEHKKDRKGRWRSRCKTPEGIFDVHGGLTYAGRCAGEICHTPAPGEPDKVYWFGFDCAHAGDRMPASEAYMAKHLYGPKGETRPIFEFETYKDLAYVQAEVEALARQLVDYERQRRRS